VTTERFAQDFALVAVHQRGKRAVAFGEYGRSGCDVCLQRGRQIISVDAHVCSGKACMFDAVFKFAHISRPMVTHEHIDGGGA